MHIFIELIIRGILIIAINDGVILYVMKKRSAPITGPIIFGIIFVTCLAFVINVWVCLLRNGVI